MLTMIHAMIIVVVYNDRVVISMIAIMVVINNAARGKQSDGSQGE